MYSVLNGLQDITANTMLTEHLITPDVTYRLELLSWAHKVLYKIFFTLAQMSEGAAHMPKFGSLPAYLKTMLADPKLHVHFYSVPSAFDFAMIQKFQNGPIGTTAFHMVRKALERGVSRQDLRSVANVLLFEIRPDQLLSKEVQCLRSKHDISISMMGADELGFIATETQLLRIFLAALQELPIAE